MVFQRVGSLSCTTNNRVVWHAVVGVSQPQVEESRTGLAAEVEWRRTPQVGTGRGPVARSVGTSQTTFLLGQAQTKSGAYLGLEAVDIDNEAVVLASH